MHLVFSSNTAWGMYNYRRHVLSHFVGLGHRVTVLAPHDEDYFGRLRALGCGVHDLPISSKGTNPLTDLTLTGRYYRLLRRLGADASITYTIKPNIYGSLAARLAGIPYLPVTTGLGYVFLHRGVVPFVAKTLYRLAFARAPRVWFLNGDDAETFRRSGLVAADRVEQLPGEGVDLNRFALTDLPQTPGTTFLLIGRMLTDKGIREYVEAAAQVRRRHPDTRFQLLGAVWKDNPATIDASQLAAWQREGTVEYLGATDDVRPFIAAADCVVLPSYREGLPCTLMEAAAMGRPLIATDVPGCREVVRDGENGFRCRARDVASLAEAMERLIGLPTEARRTMGAAGRQLMAEQFDVDRIIRRYDEAIERLAEERRK